MTPQETDQDLPVSVQESLAESWVSGGLLLTRTTAGLGALSEAVHAWDLLKEVAIIFMTLHYLHYTIFWSQVKQQGGNTALPINRKLDQRFIEHGPTQQTKTQFSPKSGKILGGVI